MDGHSGSGGGPGDTVALHALCALRALSGFSPVLMLMLTDGSVVISGVISAEVPGC
jgi:hypothetical protein